MEITLVRHGQPDWEPEGRAVDHPGLTEHGHAQARCTAEALRDEHFDGLYVSPLQRARETAQPIAGALGLEPVVHDWLRELRLPELAGSSPEQVQEFFRNARMRELEGWWDGYEGGESFRHFYERVSGGIESLLVGDHALSIHAQGAHRVWQGVGRDLRLLIVAHEGTNAIVLSHLLGIEPSAWAPLRFGSAWTGIARVHTSEVGGGFVWALEFFNRTDHLSALAHPRDGRPPREAAAAGPSAGTASG